jgi:hypothetical protein
MSQECALPTPRETLSCGARRGTWARLDNAEAEHREILREALREGADDFEARAKILRERLRSSVDTTEIIRADRDRDGAA